MTLPTIPNPWKYIGMGLAVLALIATIVFGVRGCAQDERKENKEILEVGKTVEREKGQAKVIEDVEKAINAVDNPTSDELNVVCGKYDRNCKNSL